MWEQVEERILENLFRITFSKYFRFPTVSEMIGKSFRYIASRQKVNSNPMRLWRFYAMIR